MLNYRISYAQNGEDVILARALSHVDQGFYVDVGAFDPEIDSVSKIFYDQGWSGVNIEPHPDLIEEFKLKRNRDLNIACALGEYSGRAKLTVYPGTGWHTLYPSMVGINGDLVIEEIEVEVKTLTEVLQNVTFNEIHWLKIDAEGAEFSIVKGIDFLNVRPWIIVIEATLPNTAIKAENLWTSQLLSSKYVFCFFDGLNEFWVAQEHLELRSLISYPAGVHDRYIRSADHKVRLELKAALESVEMLQRKLQTLQNSWYNKMAQRIQSAGPLITRALNKLSKLRPW